MTRRGDKLQRVNKLVVSLDICSSSRILEDLIASGNLQPLADATVEMKEFMLAMARDKNALVYKFTGDGWIILFGEPYDGKQIAEFITGANATYRHCYDTDIRPALHQAPDAWGLKFGIDDGVLLKLRMEGREEYIGRPINIACRLQGLVTGTDMKDGCQALISSSTYGKIGHALDDFSPVETRRNLRNIAGEKGFSCHKLAITPTSCEKAARLFGNSLGRHSTAPKAKRADRTETRENLLNYAGTLEAVNGTLLETLKRCFELLAQLKEGSPEEKGWQEILEDIQNIIRTGEKMYRGRTVH